MTVLTAKEDSGKTWLQAKAWGVLVLAIAGAAGIQFWLGIEYTDPMYAVEILPYEAAFAVASVILWYCFFRSHVPIEIRFRRSRTSKQALPLLLVPLIGLLLSLGFAETIDLVPLSKLAATTLCVGIAEEMYFRGIGFGAFRAAGYTPARAVLLSALLFSLFHLTNLVSGLGDIVVFQLLNTFLLGVVFGYIYFRSKNILYLMLIHFVWDFSSIGMGYQGPEGLHTAVTMLMLMMLVGYGVWAFRAIFRLK